jgi:hypothetical protein
MQQVLAMDWERLIPGHGDRLGTKQDVHDQLALLRAASAEMKKLAHMKTPREGRFMLGAGQSQSAVFWT